MKVKIVKEVKRSDCLWRFACGDVLCGGGVKNNKKVFFRETNGCISAVGLPSKKKSFYGPADRKGWPPLQSGCCDFSQISWHVLPFYDGKNWTKIFTFGYGQGRGGWPHPLPPYGQPDRKNTSFFLTTALKAIDEWYTCIAASKFMKCCKCGIW